MLRFLLLLTFPLLVSSTWRRGWWKRHSESSSESWSESSSEAERNFESEEEHEEESEENYNPRYWWQSSRLCRRCRNRYEKCIEEYDVCQLKLNRCKERSDCPRGKK